MTIAVAIQVHDGVVLASDSALTVEDRDQNGNLIGQNVFNNSNKVFNLHKKLPVGAFTYGLGNIGNSSVSTLTKDLRARFTGDDATHHDWKIDPKNYTLEQIAIRCREFFLAEMSSQPPPSNFVFGFVVAGYSYEAPLSEIWAFEHIHGSCGPATCVKPQGSFGIHAGGDPEVFARLVLGHSPLLVSALASVGVAPAIVPVAVLKLQELMHIPLLTAPMPIPDAADLGEFLIEASARFARFRPGHPTIGGPVESAAITKHEGFKWIKRKHYFNATLNPPESRNDH